ncbi:LLM class flavin-dependent oxidoreductase [Belnapia sp. T6]|uniref:LLM class flavin-dependent oxidoreductase n=1 Tax=Belnapia mucosa TaxID=2804532 RepID=A0ABS1V0S4_9PROT|nr:LLM class flavin-dependent oxidoreductase [Belnapia mucosa]MBL6454852.1 LLM class flavin-dependent oxidoreductase [Belnapia mucosa]
MDFGQFNLMGYREPGTDLASLYDGAVAQVKAAEQAGFGISWFAEHHFSNYCVCPSPLLMVARCAGETSRIRLGSGVVIVPLYQPSRLLAEIGMVDQMTHGRLVLGIGSGYQPFEFERFGADLAEATPRTLEFMEMLEQATASETFTHQGRFHSLPETHIAARPVHGVPEVWVAGDNPELHRMAARRGYVVMVTPRHYTAELLAKARARFEATYREAGQDPARMRFGALRHICVTDSKAEAEGFLENIRYQIRLSQSLRHREQHMQGGMLLEKPWPGEMSLEDMARHMLVGDAETIAERMTREVEAAQPCHYLLQFQAGASSTALALRSIEGFATRVRPLLERALGPLERIGVPESLAA